MATTISPARFIDRLQFANDCAAVRERAMEQLQDRQAQRQAYVQKWMGYVPVRLTKPQPIAPKVKAPRAQPIKQAKPPKANSGRIGRIAEQISFQGQRHTTREWAVLLGISYGTLLKRSAMYGGIEAGLMSVIETPIGQHARTFEFDGKRLTLTQWAELSGINRATLSDRIKQHGWSMERALTQPVANHDREQATGGYKPTSQEADRTGGVSTVRDIHHSVVHENAGMTP